ncbi:Protein RTF2 homolog [Talaromyces islandicus]|uniref:Protein RTF2 homolog n=1 Tax=Talaromyces islandicus TaxID=28573 RepID=A0A0U1M450_TALIS|nr:Protein RTF2 homolog [Talaromyces islandicus]
MGNDGGSIPTRRELVREAAKAPSATQVKEAQREQQEHYWTTCPLSHKPLQRPIVSDSVGNLYNKDAILKYLLGAADEEDGISSKADCDEILQRRVKSLKDVVELKFEVDEADESEAAAAAVQDNSAVRSKGEKWVCPVTRKQLGPGVRAVYIVPCGHVFAEEAVREMKSDKCLQCTEPYTQDNVIVILPTKDADKQRQMARGVKLGEQGLTHSLKKASGSKKRKKHATAADSVSTEQPKPTSSTNGSSGIKNAATAMLTAKVLEEENKKKKQKVANRNGNLQSLFHNDKDNHQLKDGDFMTRGFTIPADARR